MQFNIFSQTMLQELPDLIFWKDINSVFLGCNMNFALLAGFQSPEDIVGKTDHDMGWSSFADKYRKDDLYVMKGNSFSTIENIYNIDNKLSVLYIKKTPVYNDTKNIMGVFCFARILNKSRKIGQDYKLDFNDSTFSGLISVDKDCIQSFFWGLSEIEANILYFYIRGYSAAQIGTLMARSKRTIEDHIQHIKEKTNCPNKLTLIELSISSGFIEIIPEFLKNLCIANS